MAKSSGYLRSYRARRTANRGRPLGPALGKAASAEVEMLMRDYGYTLAKARQEVITVNRMLRDQAAIAKGDFSRIAPPRGRAPRGMGAEYAARRDIVRIMERADARFDRAWGARQSYRGAKRTRRDDNRRGEVQGAMRQFHKESRAIIQGYGSWQQKARAVREQYEYASWLVGG